MEYVNETKKKKRKPKWIKRDLLSAQNIFFKEPFYLSD